MATIGIQIEYDDGTVDNHVNEDDLARNVACGLVYSTKGPLYDLKPTVEVYKGRSVGHYPVEG